MKRPTKEIARMRNAPDFLVAIDVPDNGPSTVVNPAYAMSANSSFLADEHTLDLAGGETPEVRTLYGTIMERTWRRYAFDRRIAETWPGDKTACILSLSKEMVELQLAPAQVHALERVIVATHRVFGEHFVVVHALLKMSRDSSIQDERIARYLRRATSAIVFSLRRNELAAAQALLDTVRDKYLSPAQMATKQLVRKALAWRLREGASA
jgi:hypothetical protein